MALLHEAVDFKKLDTRLVERNIARGVMTTQQLNGALDQLPDDSENAEWTNVETLMNDSEDSEVITGQID